MFISQSIQGVESVVGHLTIVNVTKSNKIL